MATRIEVNRAYRVIVRKTLRRFPDEAAAFMVRSAQVARRDAPANEKERYRAALQEMYRHYTKGGEPVGDHGFSHWVADSMDVTDPRDGETDPTRDDAHFDADGSIDP